MWNGTGDVCETHKDGKSRGCRNALVVLCGFGARSLSGTRLWSPLAHMALCTQGRTLPSCELICPPLKVIIGSTILANKLLAIIHEESPAVLQKWQFASFEKYVWRRFYQCSHHIYVFLAHRSITWFFSQHKASRSNGRGPVCVGDRCCTHMWN